MKKVISIFLVAVLISSFSISAFADADNEDVFILRYEKIQDSIFERNLNIQSNMLSLDSLNETLKDLKNVKSGSESDLKRQIAYIDMEIEYYQNQLALLQPIVAPDLPGNNGHDDELPEGEGDGGETGDEGGSASQIDSGLYAAINTSIAYVRNAYIIEIVNLEQRREALLASSGMSNSELETQELNLNNSIIQLTLINYQMVKEAQSLFLLYHSLEFDYEDLLLQLELRKKELEFTKLRRNLGMAENKDVEAIETVIDDLNAAIDNLVEQKAEISGQINILLGREQDKRLILGPSPKIDSKKLTVNYDKDLTQAKENSYSVNIERNDYEIKNLDFKDAKKNYNSTSDEYKNVELELQKAFLSLDNKEKELEKSFDRIYNDLLDKKDALDKEEEKLLEANEDYRLATLKYNLGMISMLEQENARMQYEKQQNEYNRARHGLQKAFMEYQWIKKGLS
ncbi:MAG: TolC family protein [Acetivibrionales bacterium]|jgi:hypothetical protein|nr:TolC family protein [Clostridiaceae bacterium]